MLRIATLCLLWMGALNHSLKAADFLDPEDLMAVWDFNDASTPDQSASTSKGTILNFVGDAAFTSDRRGRSGSPGDRALDLGTTGSAANRPATPPSPAAPADAGKAQ